MASCITNTAIVVNFACAGIGLGFGSLFNAAGLTGVSAVVLVTSIVVLINECCLKLTTIWTTAASLVACGASGLGLFAFRCIADCPSGVGCSGTCGSIDLKQFAWSFELPSWAKWISEGADTFANAVNAVPEGAMWGMLFASFGLMVLSVLQWRVLFGRFGQSTKTVIIRQRVRQPPRERERREREQRQQRQQRERRRRERREQAEKKRLDEEEGESSTNGDSEGSGSEEF